MNTCGYCITTWYFIEILFHSYSFIRVKKKRNINIGEYFTGKDKMFLTNCDSCRRLNNDIGVLRANSKVVKICMHDYVNLLEVMHYDTLPMQIYISNVWPCMD